jgi:hypothetical protein
MTNEESTINYPNSLDTRVALLEMSIMNINQTLIRTESKIDKQLDEIKMDIKDLHKELKWDVRWLLTTIAGIAGSIIGIMAHGFHWF